MDTKRPTHPSYQELLLLSIDELPPRRAEEVREHLIECEACLAQMRELLRLPETPPLPEMAIDDDEQDVAWQRLQSAIASKGSDELDDIRAPLPMPAISPRQPLHSLKGVHQADLPAGRPPKRFFEGYPALLAAAMLAAAIGLGLGRWILPARISNSGVTTQIGSSKMTLRGEPVESVRSACPTSDGSFVWVVTPMYSSVQTPEKIWGKVWDANSRLVTHLELLVSPTGESTLIFQRSDLPNGTYLLQIFLTRDGPIAYEFAVVVECP